MSRVGQSVGGNKKRGLLIALLKYGFSLLATFLAFFSTFKWQILAIGLAELGLILTLSNALLKRAPILGHAVHFLLLFVYDIQMLVMYFGNSYITLLMLTNLVSLQDLSGNFGIYVLVAVPMLVILLLPMPALPVGKRWRPALGAFCLWLCLALALGGQNSPLVSAVGLIRDGIEYRKMSSSMGNRENVDVTRYFRSEVGDYRSRPEALPEKPNIILVFVEGLSQSVIEDERGLMSNLAALEERTLFFSKYYNHTFATYRGLIGQLYSGFQLSDRDANQLISLQSVLHDLGYRTTFLNTEPNNVEFTDYLDAMGFDELISNQDWSTQIYATLNYITDKDAFDRLFETASDRHGADQPFFVAMYSFGTHVSLDSPDDVFGDGTNPELNKFHNLDMQLGRFMERFEESALAEDTLVVITTDHATYMDKAFTDSFPDCKRVHNEMDRIPLMFYYKGIEPEAVSAHRSNSVDLAPTILDYLDLSAPNTFLGQSLFNEESMKGDPLPYDRCFFDGTNVSKTGFGGKRKDISNKKKKVMLEVLMDYFAVSIPSDQGSRDYDMDVQQSGDGRRLLISTGYSLQPDETMWFLVWGRPDGRNDLKGYRGELGADGIWRCEIPLEEHGETGMYYINALVGDADVMPEEGAVIMKWFYVREIPEA